MTRRTFAAAVAALALIGAAAHAQKTIYWADAAESGALENWLDGEYRSRGKIDILAYRSNVEEYRPGTSLLGTRPGTADGQPERVPGVDGLTLPAATRKAKVPRAYVFAAGMVDVAATLRA
jgi:hypothetical protein